MMRRPAEQLLEIEPPEDDELEEDRDPFVPIEELERLDRIAEYSVQIARLRQKRGGDPKERVH